MDDIEVADTPAEGPAPLPVEGQRVVRARGRLVWIGAFVGTIALIAGLIVLAGSEDKPDAKAALKAAQHIVATSDSYRFELRDTTHTQTGDPDGAGSDTTTRDVTTAQVAAKDRWHLLDTPSDAEDDDFGLGPTELVRIGDTGWVKGLFGFAGFGPTRSASPPWLSSTIPDDAKAKTVDDYVDEYESMLSPEDPSTADDCLSVLAEGAEVDGCSAVENEAADPYEPSPDELLDVALTAYVLPVRDDPVNIKRIISEATNPVVEEQLTDGGVRLRTTLAPIPKLAKLVGKRLPPVDLTIDLDGSDRPVEARFTVAVEKASREVDVRYSSWSSDITVEPPADDLVDHTPWVAEEDLAGLDLSLRLAPSTLPGDFALTNASVSWNEFTEPDRDPPCPSVDLSYTSKQEAAYAAAHADEDVADGEYPDFDYLNITVATQSCTDEYSDQTPFDEVVAGHPARWDEDTEELDLLLGDVQVQISSTFTKDELTPLAGSIRSLTVDDLAASIPEWGRTGVFGGWYAGPPGSAVGPAGFFVEE